MQIVPISYSFVDPFTYDDGVNMLRKIERIGRVSHRSEEAQTESSWLRFISSVVMNHGDFSIIEHCSVTVEVEVDRGITHEIVRHRIGAYTQESTRFVNYGKQPMRFVQPPFKSDSSKELWKILAEEAERNYLYLVNQGETPELARSGLLTSLASKLVMTYNLRTWRHFFLMRTTRQSHPQMRELTIPLLADFKARIPILFDDIEPLAGQTYNMGLKS